MELRRAEAELEEVRSAYEGLRSARIGGGTGGAVAGMGGRGGSPSSSSSVIFQYCSFALHKMCWKRIFCKGWQR